MISANAFPCLEPISPVQLGCSMLATRQEIQALLRGTFACPPSSDKHVRLMFLLLMCIGMLRHELNLCRKEHPDLSILGHKKRTAQFGFPGIPVRFTLARTNFRLLLELYMRARLLFKNPDSPPLLGHINQEKRGPSCTFRRLPSWSTGESHQPRLMLNKLIVARTQTNIHLFLPDPYKLS